MTKWVVYMLRCKDNSLYTGMTNNLENRIAMHSVGKGAKYTRNRGPFVLQYTETFQTRSQAAKREYELKQLSKKAKESLPLKEKHDYL